MKFAEYINEEPCEFIYNITAVEKVVDGDTIDAIFDLGFDVRICNRIRLLGIDTPESRTRDLEGRMIRGEPNPIDPTYGGIGHTYYKPETRDLGKVKVSLVERWNWKFEWEDVNIG